MTAQQAALQAEFPEFFNRDQVVEMVAVALAAARREDWRTLSNPLKEQWRRSATQQWDTLAYYGYGVMFTRLGLDRPEEGANHEGK